jgi:hypothetical protein
VGVEGREHSKSTKSALSLALSLKGEGTVRQMLKF